VTLVQSVGTQRTLGRRHDLYDVHCERTRWWIITDPTNLYPTERLPRSRTSADLPYWPGVFTAERNRRALNDAEAEEHVSSSWCRFSPAIDDMNDAEASEDYKAVGVKYRDALIALGKEHAAAEWVGDVTNRPQARRLERLGQHLR
jgi:hypothetical protein